MVEDPVHVKTSVVTYVIRRLKGGMGVTVMEVISFITTSAENEARNIVIILRTAFLTIVILIGTSFLDLKEKFTIVNNSQNRRSKIVLISLAILKRIILES